VSVLIPETHGRTHRFSTAMLCASPRQERYPSKHPTHAVAQRRSLLASEGDPGYHVSIESFLARLGRGWSLRSGQGSPRYKVTITSGSPSAAFPAGVFELTQPKSASRIELLPASATNAQGG
jgi:hypothetical protein